jgi:hypothetical protein
LSGSAFYSNATLDFRQWCFRWKAEENEPPLLEGLTRFRWREQLRCPWNPGRPDRAECTRLKFRPDSNYEAHGEVSKTGSSCGFYAHVREDGCNSETAIHVVGGVVAGWGNLELHGRGFRYGVAKILAPFAPDPQRSYADYDGLTGRQRATLERMCADNAIPLLPADALREAEKVRRYAYEWDLALLEDQLDSRRSPLADIGTA